MHNRILSEEEIELLLETAKDEMEKAILALVIGAGQEHRK